MRKKDVTIKYVIPAIGLIYILYFKDGSKRKLDCRALINDRPEFNVLNDSDVFWYASIDRFHKNIVFTENVTLSIEDAIKYSRVYNPKKESKELMRTIYRAGKKERQRQRITQNQIADMIGVPQSSIARLEKGDSDVQLSTILNYLAPLGLTLTITSNDVPNKTTLKAMLEADEMEKNPKKYKRYDSFDDILKEI